MTDWQYDRSVRAEDSRPVGPAGACTYCWSLIGSDHVETCVILSSRRLDAAPVGVWQPIETYHDGDFVLFWFPCGERGNGAMETAMAFRESGGRWNFWTHGGPNSGSDFEPGNEGEAPTKWCRLPNDPATASPAP